MISLDKIRVLLPFAFLLTFSQHTNAQILNPNFKIGTVTGKYNYSYNETPDQLVQIYPPDVLSLAYNFEWQSNTTPLGNDPWTVISTQPTCSFSTHLTQTLYVRCKATGLGNTGFVYSNTIKLTLVSTNWEDLNYIREHDVLTTNITDWQTVDQLPIGQKLQTTSYLDGLGRSLEKVSREVATPASQNGTWGDLVQFAKYDALGRQPLKYLPYTTITESGKYKSSPQTEQSQYYAATYNETSAFSSIIFDNSPLNRVKNIKESGTAWAASTGSSADYSVNTLSDNVQNFRADYTQGNPPINLGTCAAGTLYKLSYTDVNGKQVVEFSNTSGQLILKKIQLDDIPSAAHAGWICTYSIYDDFGLLRYQLQPEAVKYLDANNWSFAGTNGQTVLNEQCFLYNYDDKGRTIWKKAPGAQPLRMLYDIRDRVVFMQDGNQSALATPQWTANLYDELDRPVLTTLYNTGKTIAALQTDINNAVTISSFTTSTSATPIRDLAVNNRSIGTTSYTATNSIDFLSNFSSEDGAEFVAQIDASATSPSVDITSTVLNNPISSADLGNTAVTTILKYLFYDNYSFNKAKAFDNSFTNNTAYSSSDPNVLPIAASKRTWNLPTGSMTRVLGTNAFLSATSYFDEKGNAIQSLEENIKSGTDITTMQYHFDGRLLSTSLNHSAPGTDFVGFVTLNKFLFDKIGRVTALQKQIGANSLKTISSFDYDDIGRVKTKHLDPDYNNPNSGQADLESLNYNFNIHNQIIGINKDYALKAPASYNKWNHFFGMYLGFDNRDNTFSQSQLNGQVGGILWNTQGDDAQRKYEYTYDNAGRLTNAVFNEQQHPGDGWSNGKMDFSVSGAGGKITYDLNGNLLTMLQKGVVPGTAAPITVDDLHYTYAAYSNKLQSVTDQMTLTSSNGLFGDFKDGSNGAAPDYVYDANGNLVIDLNKNAKDLNNLVGANGISYNFLDKPDQIRIAGKGTIKVVYDADGEKLQRVFIPETAGNTTITTYIGGFVYQETGAMTINSPAPFAGTSPSLAYINFEEGRIRVMQPFSQSNGLDGIAESGNILLSGGKMGVYDYFIMDYQRNVRMILTEETHTAANTATMEFSRSAAEDPVFGQTGANNEVEATRFPTPGGWQSVNSSASVSRLGNLSGHNIGPNTLQKVMAGDKITASVQYYFDNPGSGSNPNFATNLLNSLSQAIIGSATASQTIHSNVANITNQLNAAPAFLNAVQPTGSGGTTPQAYLTILFFDERFNFIAAEDGGVAQQQVQPTWSAGNQILGLTDIKAPKNGYAFAYVSNRSDQNVYFDNMLVGTTAGNIIEENHYYAFGLKISGISSRKLGDANEGKLKNPYQYNGKEMLDEDADLNWLDYGFRSYDPQIGRFMQLDPLTDFYADLTPYQYSSNDPITNIDLDGLEGVKVVGQIGEEAFRGGVATTLQDVVVTAVIKSSKVTAKAAPSIFSVSGHFIFGVLKSAWKTVEGVGNMVAHPLNTATALVKIIAHPVETAILLQKVIKKAYNDFKAGDANKRSEMIGEIAGDIAQLFIGTGEAKIAEEAADAGRIIEEASELEKVTNEAESLSKMESAWAKALKEEKNSHHGIPKELKNDPAVRDMRKGGYKYDGKDNRIDVPKRRQNGEVFHANHPFYTEQIKTFLSDLRSTNPKWASATSNELANFGREFNTWLVGELKEAFRKNIKINELELDFTKFKPSLLK
jgi:RHS repeat-associated protein